MKSEKGDFCLFPFHVLKLPSISSILEGERYRLPLIFNRKAQKQMAWYKGHF